LGGNLGWKPGCRASSKRLWSGYVMPLALALVSGINEAESQFLIQSTL
jgi:hypothetical protein